MFRAICPQEVSDLIKGLNVNKSTIGIPTKCIKLADNHISEAQSEALASIFNNSFSQGIVPDVLKISKVTPVDKGGTALFQKTTAQFQHFLHFHKYLKSLFTNNSLVILKNTRLSTNANSGLERDILLNKQ